jgi:DNA-directed RNA polymerase specialized sigma subunit
MVKKKKYWNDMTEEEREEYIKQDEVARQEGLIDGDIDYSASLPYPISNEEVIIKMFFVENKGIMDIARDLKISHQYVSSIVAKYKKLIDESLSDYAIDYAIPSRDIEVLKQFFLNQKTEIEVSELIKISQSHVSRIITKYKKFLIENMKK